MYREVSPRCLGDRHYAPLHLLVFVRLGEDFLACKQRSDIQFNRRHLWDLVMKKRTLSILLPDDPVLQRHPYRCGGKSCWRSSKLDLVIGFQMFSAGKTY